MSTATLERPDQHLRHPRDRRRRRDDRAALRARGFEVRIAKDRDEATGARARPHPCRLGGQPGLVARPSTSWASVRRSSSETEYVALKPLLWSMDRATQGKQIRQLGSAPDVMVGSVHAITAGRPDGDRIRERQPGRCLRRWCRAGGATSSAPRRSCPTLTARSRASRSYVFPLEDARAQAAYGDALRHQQAAHPAWRPPRPHLGGAGQGRHRLLARARRAVPGVPVRPLDAPPALPEGHRHAARSAVREPIRGLDELVEDARLIEGVAGIRHDVEAPPRAMPDAGPRRCASGSRGRSDPAR